MASSTLVRTGGRVWKYRVYQTFYNGSTSDSGWVTHYAWTAELFRKSKTWVRTPNYFQIVRQGQHLPDNNFSFEEERVNDALFTVSIHQNHPYAGPLSVQHSQVDWEVPTPNWGPQRPSDTLSDASLRAKLIDRAKSAEWSAPVFFGEGRQVVNLVLNTARTLGSAFRDLRRGNLGGALASLGIQGDASQRRRYYRQYGLDPRRAAANQWLALTYGWRPLLADVYNAAETLAETVTREENREGRVTASTSKTDRVIKPNHTMSVSPSILATRVTMKKETLRGVWRFKPTSLDAWGSFGFLNPASVAWELVPFSFVVDWFLPVGRYLEGLDVPMRFQHLGGTIGRRNEIRDDFSNLMFDGHAMSGTHFASRVELNRSKLLGHPTVGLGSIVFEPKLGAARATSAIALMAQIFGR